jgi:hypothetical protein
MTATPISRPSRRFTAPTLLVRSAPSASGGISRGDSSANEGRCGLSRARLVRESTSAPSSSHAQSDGSASPGPTCFPHRSQKRSPSATVAPQPRQRPCSVIADGA